MNNEERDNMLIEMHGDVKVIRQKVGDHGSTLYGPDGNSGITKEVTLLQERQDSCPARIKNTMESRRLGLATIAIIVSILALLANIVLTVIK